MALLPPRFLNTVVALGYPSQDGKIQYSATGFLYGYPTGDTNEEGSILYYIYLVTNRHVFQSAFDGRGELRVRLNKPDGSGANIYPVSVRGHDDSPSWTVHPSADVDVAVVRLNVGKLQQDGVELSWFAADKQTFTLDQIKTVQIAEGDGVFVLGFPLGEAGTERNYTIVRQGIIARAQDWLSGATNTFLIDASIFPGNSGGPVLLKPELASVEGTKSNNRCMLIGMVSSYLPYREIAVSQQTGRQRMLFEENSGLGVVVPHDMIAETVKVEFEKD